MTESKINIDYLGQWVGRKMVIKDDLSPFKAVALHAALNVNKNTIGIPKAGDEPDGDGFVTDPQGAVDGSTRVVRGGGWDNNADYCTVGARNNGYPDERNDYIGLRLACRP